MSLLLIVGVIVLFSALFYEHTKDKSLTALFCAAIVVMSLFTHYFDQSETTEQLRIRETWGYAKGLSDTYNVFVDAYDKEGINDEIYGNISDNDYGNYIRNSFDAYVKDDPGKALYEAGKEDGNEKGFDKGHEDGYDTGYDNGYDDGYYDGSHGLEWHEDLTPVTESQESESSEESHAVSDFLRYRAEMQRKTNEKRAAEVSESNSK
uniref:Essential protein Yae1, N terminal n=1 Tax=Phage sp. ctXnn1 TaxID=2826749 RepID=A0A8S5N9B8_9VIRU|nr:MAG TPA: Essential protein Yae1, N terminal [Phage sp. ctXnn1]